MTWFWISTQLLLACLCYSQAVLTVLSFHHHHDTRLIIFITSYFALGTFLSASSFLQPSVILVLLQSVLCVFYFASNVILLVFLSSWFAIDDNLKVSFANIIPAILSLSLASMLTIGVFLSIVLLSKSTRRETCSEQTKDPESGATGWQSDQLSAEKLSLNKAHTTQFRPPNVRLDLSECLLSNKTLRNKDSDGTLVVPSMSREDDVSLNWLIQASMSNSAMYESSSENWMSTKPFHFGHDIIEFNNNLLQNGVIPDPSGSFNLPKTRVNRSNTTGLILYSRTVVDTHGNAEASDITTKRRLSSISLNENIPKDKVSNENFENVLRASRRIPTLKNTTDKVFERNPRYLNDISYTYGRNRNSRQILTPHLKGEGDDVWGEGSLISYTNGKNRDITPENFSLFPKKTYTEIDYVPDNSDSSLPGRQNFLLPAFKATFEDASRQNPRAGLPEKDLLEGLEYTPLEVPKWSQNTENDTTLLKNISLHEWEANKDQWLRLCRSSGPILYSSNSQHKLAESVGGMSAPSLHTYRENSNQISRISTNTLPGLFDTLHKFTTPQQDEFDVNLQEDPQESSPIKKMIGRLKRKDSIVENRHSKVLLKHKHSSSIATSMISVASAISSRSSSPRKYRNKIFSRRLLDLQPKKPSLAKLPPVGHSPNFQKDDLELNQKAYLFTPHKPWDYETGEFLDKSRVSSVPSAVIGKYDREKWRTMKELQTVE